MRNEKIVEIRESEETDAFKAIRDQVSTILEEYESEYSDDYAFALGESKSIETINQLFYQSFIDTRKYQNEIRKKIESLNDPEVGEYQVVFTGDIIIVLIYI